MAFTDHRPRLAAVAARQCYGTAEGEDVVQDVFATLFAHPDRFDAARGPLLPLLYTQARTRAIDVSRSERSRRRREERGDDMVRLPDSESLAVDRVIHDRLRLALARLSYDQREVIVLAFFGGRTYREVATLIDVPEGTVKTRIRAGLGRLRMDLASDGLTAAEVAE